MKDLKGKSISGDDDLLRAILQKHGLEPDKTVTIVQTRTTDPRRWDFRRQARHGQCRVRMAAHGDHGKAGRPSRSFLRGGQNSEVPVSGIGTTDKLIRERPDMVKKFIAGTLQTMSYMRNGANKRDVVSHYEAMEDRSRDGRRVLQDDAKKPHHRRQSIRRSPPSGSGLGKRRGGNHRRDPDFSECGILASSMTCLKQNKTYGLGSMRIHSTVDESAARSCMTSQLGWRRRVVL